MGEPMSPAMRRTLERQYRRLVEDALDLERQAQEIRRELDRDEAITLAPKIMGGGNG